MATMAVGIPLAHSDVSNLGGGNTDNADWGMTDTDKFIAYVFGYSENMAVYSGVTIW